MAGGAHGDVQIRGFSTGMLTAGAMAVFALDIGQILQFRRHGRVVAHLQDCRECPAELLLNIIETAVHGQWSLVVTQSVAGKAALVVEGSQQPIDATLSHRRVQRLTPRSLIVTEPNLGTRAVA